MIRWGKYALCFITAVTATVGCSKQESPSAGADAAKSVPVTTNVTYFHRDFRCPSCEKIESLAQKAVEEAFADELASGMMVWQAVNIDKEGNAHYETDYGLKMQSVVVSVMQGQDQLRWRNLEKVWDLLNDDAAFTKYVQDEVRAVAKDPAQENSNES